MESALVYDSLLMLRGAVDSLNNHDFLGLKDPGGSDVSCEREKPWSKGATFFNYLNAASGTGLTGKLDLDVRVFF